MKPEPKFCPTCGLASDTDIRLAQREMELVRVTAALAELVNVVTAMQTTGSTGQTWQLQAIEAARAALAEGDAK